MWTTPLGYLQLCQRLPSAREDWPGWLSWHSGCKRRWGEGSEGPQVSAQARTAAVCDKTQKKSKDADHI